MENKIGINLPVHILKDSLDDIRFKSLSHFINNSFLRFTIQPKMDDLTNDVVILLSTSLLQIVKVKVIGNMKSTTNI